MANALELHLVSKIYEVGGVELVALDHVDLTLAANEVVTLLGPSGSGKTTLLSIAGGLLSATSGRVVVGGEDVTKLNPRKLTRFRRERVGFIFQAVNLVPFLTARENLLVVAELARRKKSVAKARAERLLDELGLGRRMDNLPAQLSGGERQRVAIGRALMNSPELVLVDEPTSALDSDLGQQVMELIVSEVKARGAAAVVVTHDARITRFGDRILNMADGRIAGIAPRPEWTTHRPAPDQAADQPDEAAEPAEPAVETRIALGAPLSTAAPAPTPLPPRRPRTPTGPAGPPRRRPAASPDPTRRPAASPPDPLDPPSRPPVTPPPFDQRAEPVAPSFDLEAESLRRPPVVEDSGFWKEADDSGKFRRRKKRPPVEIGGFGTDSEPGPTGDIVAAEAAVPLDEDSPLSPPWGTPVVADGLPVLVPGLAPAAPAGSPPAEPLAPPLPPPARPMAARPDLSARRPRPPTPPTGTPAARRDPRSPAGGTPAVPEPPRSRPNPHAWPAAHTPEQVAWRDLVEKGAVQPARNAPPPRSGDIDVGAGFTQPSNRPPTGPARPRPDWVDTEGLPVLVPGLPPARRAQKPEPEPEPEEALDPWPRPRPEPIAPGPMPVPGTPPRPARGSLASPIGPPGGDNTDPRLSIWPRPEPPVRPSPRPAAPDEEADEAAIWPTTWWGSEDEDI